jgi:hypothetical protein
MKVLVATHAGQGMRPSDFCWTDDGELAGFPVVCDTDNRPGADPDSGCGCGRAFAGLTSHKATTTAKVADWPDLTAEHLFTLYRRSLDDGGWTQALGEDDANRWADQDVRKILEIAAPLPPGTVLELRGEYVQVRPVPEQCDPALREDSRKYDQ